MRHTALSFLDAKGAAFTGAAGQVRWFQHKRPGAANFAIHRTVLFRGNTPGVLFYFPFDVDQIPRPCV